MCQSQAVSQELEQGHSNEARGRDLNGEQLFCLVTGLGRIQAVREQLVGSQVGHRVTVAAGLQGFAGIAVLESPELLLGSAGRATLAEVPPHESSPKVRARVPSSRKRRPHAVAN